MVRNKISDVKPIAPKVWVKHGKTKAVRIYKNYVYNSAINMEININKSKIVIIANEIKDVK